MISVAYVDVILILSAAPRVRMSFLLLNWRVII